MIADISFNFAAIDDYAWTIFIVGIVIVFIGLISLSILFQYLPLVFNFNKTKPKETPVSKKQEIKHNVDETENEIYAAITLALHLHLNDMHDDESMILTIDRNLISQSAWGSKIHNVNN